MAEAKTKVNNASVSDFLAKVVDDGRRKDCKTVAKMMQEVTGEKPRMWGSSIVGFGKYAYKYESGREGESLLIGFSPRKNDLTLYIMPGVAAFPEVMAKLGKYKTGKSCLYLKKLEDVDAKVLRTLIEKAVKEMASKRVGVG